MTGNQIDFFLHCVFMQDAMQVNRIMMDGGLRNLEEYSCFILCILCQLGCWIYGFIFVDGGKRDFCLEINIFLFSLLLERKLTRNFYVFQEVDVTKSLRILKTIIEQSIWILNGFLEVFMNATERICHVKLECGLWNGLFGPIKKGIRACGIKYCCVNFNN